MPTHTTTTRRATTTVRRLRLGNDPCSSTVSSTVLQVGVTPHRLMLRKSIEEMFLNFDTDGSSIARAATKSSSWRCRLVHSCGMTWLMCATNGGQWKITKKSTVRRHNVPVPHMMRENVAVAVTFLRPNVEAPTQAHLVRHSSWIRVHHHQGKPRTSARRQYFTNPAMEKRADWDHGRHRPATKTNESSANS